MVFAIDSVPATFGITYDGFILLTSNIFAILGLRAMYFIILECVGRLRFLHLGLSAVLIFVGLKIMLSHTSLSIGTMQSLFIILGLLSGTALASFIFPRISKENN